MTVVAQGGFSGFQRDYARDYAKKTVFFQRATTITVNLMKMGHHATEAPKKIMVITIMQRNNVKLPALRDYAKKGRIFIKVRMVQHVKLIKIREKKFSLTWSYYANRIFNPAMVVLATLFLDLLAIFKKKRGPHVKSH